MGKKGGHSHLGMTVPLLNEACASAGVEHRADSREVRAMKVATCHLQIWRWRHWREICGWAGWHACRHRAVGSLGATPGGETCNMFVAAGLCCCRLGVISSVITIADSAAFASAAAAGGIATDAAVA